MEVRSRAHRSSADSFDKPDVLAASLLALATALAVAWQNARMTILWDFSYVIENATRIAFGDVPYRDFPFPYAPLTFAMQALIIKLFGRAAWHHMLYAAIAGGVATFLTYAIVRAIEPRRLSAIVLTAPVTILGIYSIFPHPFYDPDACLAVLMVLFLITREKWIAAGAMSVVAVFVKQNIGLALVIAIVLLALITRRWRVLAGVAAASAIAVIVVAMLFGLHNYIRWTITFAASRRLPPMRDMIAIYTHPLDVASPLLRMWAPLLVAGFIAAVFALIKHRDFVPLLALAAIHGAFLSQQVWGSTYGIWPLLIIITAYTLNQWSAGAPAGARMALAIAIGITLFALGIPYVLHNERLTYVKLDGDSHRAYGLTVAGEWLPDFEELVAWTDRNIPVDDAIVFLPGEDPFYFVSGRRPRFPVLMFDRTINPYDVATLVRLANERNVRWIIVRERLQLNGTPMPERDAAVAALRGGARLAARLHDYAIWERPVNTRPSSLSGERLRR